MTDQTWQAIERSLAGLTREERREVADRILQSLRDQAPASDRARQQRDAMDRLCRELDALPAAEQDDGLTNRDHDRLIYTR